MASFLPNDKKELSGDFVRDHKTLHHSEQVEDGIEQAENSKLWK